MAGSGGGCFRRGWRGSSEAEAALEAQGWAHRALEGDRRWFPGGSDTALWEGPCQVTGTSSPEPQGPPHHPRHKGDGVHKGPTDWSRILVSFLFCPENTWYVQATSNGLGRSTPVIRVECIRSHSFVYSHTKWPLGVHYCQHCPNLQEFIIWRQEKTSKSLE